MQLSIMLTTHRAGLSTIARVAHACSFAGPELEVVVRDNSGGAQKRDLLDRMRWDYCNIVLAEPCDGLTNHVEALRLTKGDFVFVAADDDFCLEHGIAALPPVLSEMGSDPAYCGVTGGFLLESKQGSSAISITGRVPFTGAAVSARWLRRSNAERRVDLP